MDEVPDGSMGQPSTSSSQPAATQILRRPSLTIKVCYQTITKDHNISARLCQVPQLMEAIPPECTLLSTDSNCSPMSPVPESAVRDVFRVLLDLGVPLPTMRLSGKVLKPRVSILDRAALQPKQSSHCKASNRPGGKSTIHPPTSQPHQIQTSTTPRSLRNRTTPHNEKRITVSNTQLRPEWSTRCRYKSGMEGNL